MFSKRTVKKLKQNGLYVLFTGPAMLFFFIFIICSLGLGIYYSFRDWNGISPTSNFVGIQNYLRVFKDADFRSSLLFTLKYTLVTVVLVNLLALLLALGLNAKIKGRGILRTAFFTPMVISSVTSGYLWNFIIVRLFSMLGQWTGIEALQKNWFSYPNLAFAAVILVTVWQLTGYYMLIYLTGLQGVPQEMIEAARISSRPMLSMVTDMLGKAFSQIPDGTGLILHSDQGWQYQHKLYQQLLKKKGIVQSMSRKGNCLDNAVIENFFGLLKSELLYLQEFDSMEHFIAELTIYLDYYNNCRIKQKLKGLPPAVHRQQALQAA